MVAALREKLARRRNRPGFAVNVAEIEAEIAMLEANKPLYRDRQTGRFVTEAYALANPKTTELVE